MADLHLKHCLNAKKEQVAELPFDLKRLKSHKGSQKIFFLKSTFSVFKKLQENQIKVFKFKIKEKNDRLRITACHGSEWKLFRETSNSVAIPLVLVRSHQKLYKKEKERLDLF